MNELAATREPDLTGIDSLIAACRRRDRRSIERFAAAAELGVDDALAMHLLALLANDPVIEATLAPYRLDPAACALTVRDLLDLSQVTHLGLDLGGVTRLEREGLLLVDRLDAFTNDRSRRLSMMRILSSCLLPALAAEALLPQAASLHTGDASLPATGVHPAAADRLAALARGGADRPALVVALVAAPGADPRRAGRDVAGRARRHLLSVDASLLPSSAREATALLVALGVAARCHGWILQIEAAEQAAFPASVFPLVAARLRGLLLFTAESVEALPPAVSSRLCDAVTVVAPRPQDALDQVHAALGVWPPSLGTMAPAGGATLEEVIRRAAALVGSGGTPIDEVEHALRRLGGASPQGGAWLLSPTVSVDDLVLPTEQADALAEIAAACRAQAQVLDGWGFRAIRRSGHGIGVLLDGPPGTGKTMAAHALAHAVSRPVLQVDVPSVLSRWLGETEQRLSELFRRARSLDAVLLFDEADSFFARRTTEIRGANDRYANVEVNTVLQLLEAHEGLVVLTTNLAEALDPAVRRRLRYRLTLEAPGAAERTKLWQRNLPASAPLADDIDVEQLAIRFELTGAHVANAALRAAASAASRGSSITREHLEDAARAECRALGILCRED